MQGARSVRHPEALRARAGLGSAFVVTVGALVLAERFGDLLPALGAFAGAAWVFRLRPASGRRR